MSDFNIVNLNDFTWQLNVALAGGLFAIFALMYDVYYIHYGLLTAFFGIVAHIVYKFFEWVFRKDGVEDSFYWISHFFNMLFAIGWLTALLHIY